MAPVVIQPMRQVAFILVNLITRFSLFNYSQMSKFLFAILFTGTLLVGCSKGTDNNSDPDTIGYFMTNLKADMKYADFVNTFGQPDGDLGSGIHIYYYNLKDGTKVYIGYTDKIEYARHVSSSGTIIHTLI